MILRSAQECCQRGASSQENGIEVNCRRNFSEGFSNRTILQIKLHLKQLHFNQILSNARLHSKMTELGEW